MADNASEPPSRRSIRKRLAELIAGQHEPEQAAPHGDVADASPQVLRLRLREFETATVRDVMTARVDITAIEVGATLEDVMNLFAAEAHSRMPVYRESLDDVLGFIHIKDVVAKLVRVGWTPETLSSRPLPRLRRDILFVAESTPLPDLLVQMQTTRTHMAIVIDEYGGAGGMVCLEDLVEQIVGDIEDEHDDASPVILRCGRNAWEMDGLAEIEAVERVTGLSLAVEAFEDEVDTIGGLVSAIAGRVPQAGDIVEHPRGPEIEVMAADPRRVTRLRLRPVSRAASAAAAIAPAAPPGLDGSGA